MHAHTACGKIDIEKVILKMIVVDQETLDKSRKTVVLLSEDNNICSVILVL